MCRVSVQDTGYGIAEKRQSELFQPFNRLGKDESDIEGTGIGLTVTKQIVELMGGSIGFESKENVGSTFWFDLPLAYDIEDRELTINEGNSCEVVDGKYCAENMPCKTVLYVEDNLANICLMENIFEKMPHMSLVHARTAEIGIAMAEERDIDLILMDINLPGMDGIEALRFIRKIDKLYEVPAIVVSANAMPEELDRAIAAGFQQYVTKPIDVREMIEIVTSAVA